MPHAFTNCEIMQERVGRKEKEGTEGKKKRKEGRSKEGKKEGGRKWKSSTFLTSPNQ